MPVKVLQDLPLDNLKLLTVAEAAQAIGCSHNTLKASLSRGDGPPVVRLGKRWRRIEADALRAWAQRPSPVPEPEADEIVPVIKILGPEEVRELAEKRRMLSRRTPAKRPQA